MVSHTHFILWPHTHFNVVFHTNLLPHANLVVGSLPTFLLVPHVSHWLWLHTHALYRWLCTHLPYTDFTVGSVPTSLSLLYQFCILYRLDSWFFGCTSTFFLVLTILLWLLPTFFRRFHTGITTFLLALHRSLLLTLALHMWHPLDNNTYRSSCHWTPALDTITGPQLLSSQVHHRPVVLHHRLSHYRQLPCIQGSVALLLYTTYGCSTNNILQHTYSNYLLR